MADGGCASGRKRISGSNFCSSSTRVLSSGRVVVIWVAVGRGKEQGSRAALSEHGAALAYFSKPASLKNFSAPGWNGMPAPDTAFSLVMNLPLAWPAPLAFWPASLNNALVIS